MSKKIKVIIKDPGKVPRSVWISPPLENIRKIVGRETEKAKIAEDFAVIFNKEGRLQRLPFNECCGVNFVGTVILSGVDGDEFADIPIDFQTAKRLFPRLWCERGKK